MSKGYLKLVQHHHFRLLWIGQTISQFGNTFYEIALIWLALQITHQNYPSIGLVIFARFLPYPLFGLLGGAYSDRWNRKYTMIVCETLSGLVILIVPLLDMLGWLTLWNLALSAFLLSTLRLFFSPSLQAALPDVLSQEQLAAGNGLLHSSLQFSEVVGPLAASSLLILTAPRNLFVFDGITFFFSALLLLFFHLPAKISRSQQGESNVMQDIVGTFQQLRNSPIVLLSIILFGVEVLAIAGITRLGIPAYAIQILQGGPQVYSILVSGMAFGTVIGALLVGRLPIKTYALWIFACWMLYGTFLTLLPMTSWFPLAVVLTILTGGVGAFVDVLMALLIQCKVPKEKIGKVFSLWSTVANMSEAASSPLVGFLLGAFRLVPVFVGCGLMTAIFGLLSLFKVMQVKSVKSLNEIQS